jgi:hypothetical protein
VRVLRRRQWGHEEEKKVEREVREKEWKTRERGVTEREWKRRVEREVREKEWKTRKRGVREREWKRLDRVKGTPPEAILTRRGRCWKPNDKRREGCRRRDDWKDAESLAHDQVAYRCRRKPSMCSVR